MPPQMPPPSAHNPYAPPPSFPPPPPGGPVVNRPTGPQHSTPVPPLFAKPPPSEVLTSKTNLPLVIISPTVSGHKLTHLLSPLLPGLRFTTFPKSIYSRMTNPLTSQLNSPSLNTPESTLPIYLTLLSLEDCLKLEWFLSNPLQVCNVLKDVKVKLTVDVASLNESQSQFTKPPTTIFEEGEFEKK